MKRAALTKERVAEWLQRRFYLRLHMFFILGGTYLAGMLATKLLLLAGLNLLWLRYAPAVCASYAVFLVLIRLWLAYVSRDHYGVDLNADGIELFSRFWPGDVNATGGGSFGGGGASASWGEASQQAIAAPAPKVSGSGGGKGCGVDIGGDEGCVVVLLIVLVFSLVVVAVYMIYTAPVLLSEAAFEAALAATLARRAKKIECRGWVDTVWRATIWPFLGVLIVSALLGWAVQHKCPEAQRLRDAFHCQRGR